MYKHNPHSLRDFFRNTKPQQSVFVQIMFRVCMALAFLFVVVILINEWQQAQASAPAPLCPDEMVAHIDNYGNVICAKEGADLGRGIKSWRFPK